MRKSRFQQYQGDLFIANASFVRTKELQPLMATNWFSISKTPRTEPIIHEYDRHRVQIDNPTGKGIATIWDNDILIFLISQIWHARNHEQETSNRIQFTGYEFFQFHMRKWRQGISGKRSYELLWAALERLHTTHIHTDIKPHGDIEEGNVDFYWLPHIERLKRRGRDEVGYEVFIDPKLYEWITNKSNILTLNPEYFDITSGLGRFIYLWSRKSVGVYDYKKDWVESFDSLREKSGSTLKRGQFNQLMRRIIKDDSLPTYTIAETVHPRGPQLLVQHRNFEPYS